MVLFIVGSELAQALNQMILIPMKYSKELSKMKKVSSLVSAFVAKDKLSFVAIYVAEYSMFATLAIAGIFRASPGFVSLAPWVIYVGVGIIAVGELIRLWATYTLGKFFTYVVITPKDHRLIVKGPYNFVRHPAYLGGLLIITGFGIVSQSIFLGAIALVVLCLAYAYRITVEEKALRQKFGRGYDTYSAKTPAIIPYLF
jgi:protein-S-isoprenylcysteine O-methyltransferase Ste14